jgi:hypothetical protein
MGDSIAERMDAGWQAARHWETECEAARNQLAAVTAERDSLKHAVEQAERALMEIGACSCEIGADVERLVHAHRCALLAKEQATDKLAAVALVRLEDGA